MKYRIEVIVFRGQWHWRIVHKNGQILAHSEKYSSKRKAMQTAKAVMLNMKPDVAVLIEN